MAKEAAKASLAAERSERQLPGAPTGSSRAPSRRRPEQYDLKRCLIMSLIRGKNAWGILRDFKKCRGGGLHPMLSYQEQP
ncbi:MAG: hypothetical protein C4531_01825 [Desulfurivibrio sp.]|nr:MAG: hypothetical protein C4531_01825 [Desulfurivibrio sp.]